LVALLLLAWTVTISGCASSTGLVPYQLSCSDVSTSALTHYDSMSAAFLDETTRHPVDNSYGAIVWNTRYYLDSLITAYQATGNPKYAQAFLDSGSWVMNLAQTIPVLNTADPTAPGVTGPTINVTGWPTLLGNYGTPTPVPAENGKISLYAQSLVPYGGPVTLQVTQPAAGTLQLEWLNSGNQVLQTNSVSSLSDLQTLASQPLTWGQSQWRIFVTGAGMPAPVQSPIGTQENTVWHEQTGGILLPFAQFLLLAKEQPGLADPSIVEQWTAKVLSIASSYEDQFIADGEGGLRFHNPPWLPNPSADTDAAADYIFVEAELRLVLYELTADPHQLALSKGLTLHQQMFHWQVNSDGWLELKVWPCLIPWSTQTSKAAGSIWDNYQYDPSTPAASTDASFVADFLDAAARYDKLPQLGIDLGVFNSQQTTFMHYMVGGVTIPFAGPRGIMRANFPTADSKEHDPITYSADPWAAAAWAPPELSNESFTSANWNWMLQYGQDTEGYGAGYVLRAWARSEAGLLNACAAK
jgi:hypothetical protein